jgi:arylsulfatase A-like enzyme
VNSDMCDVVIDFQRLDESRRTLGEIFHEAGYRTMGVFSAPYVHGHFGFGRGMDFYERATQEPMMFDLTPAQMREQLGMLERRSHTEVTSSRVVDRALNLLEHMGRDRNLLFLHFFDPHYDYKAPPRFLKRFADPAYRGPVTGENVGDPLVVRADMAAADLAQVQALYDAELAWVDDNLRRLVEAIEASPRARQTVLVITGDHGEEFFEHGRFGHRATLHDEVLRVPCLVWAPGRVAPGTVVEDEVAGYDVLPTLMDYAGIPAEPAIYGRSLRPLLEGRALPPRPVSASLSFFPREPQGHFVQHEALVFQGLKLERRIHVPWSTERERDLSGTPDPSTEELQVFDLASDAAEQHDLSASGDPRIPGLRRAFDEERARQATALAAFEPLGAGSGQEIDLSLQEQLQAVGYLHGPQPATPAAAPPAPAPGPSR